MKLYSLLPNFVEWFLPNILVTKCRSHMGFSALDSESKLWHLIFFALNDLLVTLPFHFMLPLEKSGFLEPLACILATTKMKTCNHYIFEARTFYIGFNGHLPDEYFPDAIKKNWLYPNHTISILWWYAKLCYSSSSSFRVICKKPFHKIKQRTVIIFLPAFTEICLWLQAIWYLFSKILPMG